MTSQNTGSIKTNPIKKNRIFWHALYQHVPEEVIKERKLSFLFFVLIPQHQLTAPTVRICLQVQNSAEPTGPWLTAGAVVSSRPTSSSLRSGRAGISGSFHKVPRRPVRRHSENRSSVSLSDWTASHLLIRTDYYIMIPAAEVTDEDDGSLRIQIWIRITNKRVGQKVLENCFHEASD